VKGIPIWQPFASLVACGAKEIETRHWSAPPSLVGERIAIYATRRKSELGLCRFEPFSDFIPDLSALPLGAIVATAVLRKSVEMTEASIREIAARNPAEIEFGHYAPGRFAWHLSDVEAIEPVPFVWPHRGPAKYVHVPDNLITAGGPT
jgi:hypothetical protein